MTIIAGLHHVTSIVSNAERSLDFYCGTLGMSLVSRTVNLDETSILQLYCGDDMGSSGTLLSMLEYPKLPKGRAGFGEIGSVGFAIAQGTGAAWRDKLARKRTMVEGSGWTFGEQHILFHDPDGLALALIEDGQPSPDTSGADREADDLRVGRIKQVELNLHNFEYTARLLREALGLAEEKREGPVVRFSKRSPSGRASVDVVCVPNRRRAQSGTGSADSLVFAVTDAEALESLRLRLVQFGFDTTFAMDRDYFSAIYFQGPEGLSFGAACPFPGFASAGVQIGGQPWLRLPRWLEPNRKQIERRLRKARNMDREP